MINKGDTLNGTSAANYTYLEIKTQKRDHNERKHLEINVGTNIKIKTICLKYNSACDDVGYITSRLSTKRTSKPHTHTNVPLFTVRWLLRVCALACGASSWHTDKMITLSSDFWYQYNHQCETLSSHICWPTVVFNCILKWKLYLYWLYLAIQIYIYSTY